MTDLVERVSKIYEDHWKVMDHYAARAAIRLVLEEAAKMTLMMPASMVAGSDPYAKGYEDACRIAAAAIRSMMPEVK